MDILGSIADTWEAWGATKLFETPAPIPAKTVTENITEAVKLVPSAIVKVVKETPKAVLNVTQTETVQTATRSELVAKVILFGFGATSIGLGANFIYRGLTQNCSFRNVLKTPISLIPREEGLENEQMSSPLGWVDRAKSIGQRIAFPAIVGLLPIFGGGLILWNLGALAYLFTPNSD